MLAMIPGAAMDESAESVEIMHLFKRSLHG